MSDQAICESSLEFGFWDLELGIFFECGNLHHLQYNIMEAIIIIIGSEVLSGETLDTNSQFIGKLLNNTGIPVIKKITIPDDKAMITQALSEANDQAEIVIITGGLGPTNDDITKKTLAEYFNSKLVFNKEVFEHVKELFKNRFPQLTKLNEEQAMIPACATALRNRLGTAPGLLIEHLNKIVIALPGVPYETQNLMTEEVLPFLANKFNKFTLINKNIRTIGLGESLIANQLKDIEDNLPENIKLAYLPHLGQVKLRLTAYGRDHASVSKQLELITNSISEQLSNIIYGYDDEELQECMGRLLKNEKASLSIAESCTGGYISHLITSIPGCSDYFKGSVVSYANEIKINELGIDENILKQFGAVSQENAEAMAQGIRNRFNTDYALATTGIAGPDGGSAEKPVGTCWFAVASKNKTISKKIVFDRGRKQNIEFFSINALNLLRKMILEIE